jgi:hypothetical protein
VPVESFLASDSAEEPECPASWSIFNGEYSNSLMIVRSGSLEKRSLSEVWRERFGSIGDWTESRGKDLRTEEEDELSGSVDGEMGPERRRERREGGPESSSN